MATKLKAGQIRYSAHLKSGTVFSGTTGIVSAISLLSGFLDEDEFNKVLANLIAERERRDAKAKESNG